MLRISVYDSDSGLLATIISQIFSIRLQRSDEALGLQKSHSSSSTGEPDVADGASSHSSTEEDPDDVYGLYKGLKQDDGYSSTQEDMAMWSPEFSFNTQSSSSQSSGFNSSRSGLRRVKVTTK